VLFAAAAVLYAFCEGAFSSWATTFAHDDRNFSLETGERALSGFWFALTGTRALLALLPVRAAATKVAFVTFPFAIALTFLLLPAWHSSTTLIFGFVAGGAACSIVFPYAVSLALAAMPGDEDRTASVMVASLITGEGIGTYVMGVLRTNAGLSLTQIYRISAVIAVAVAIAALLAVKRAPLRPEAVSNETQR
jgi:fucose permease